MPFRDHCLLVPFYDGHTFNNFSNLRKIKELNQPEGKEYVKLCVTVCVLVNES